MQLALTNSIPRGRSLRWALTVNSLFNMLMLLKGTLRTMPPRLAYYVLSNIPNQSQTISRTPWDEMCSVFLCFIHAILDECHDPDEPPFDRQATLAYFNLRMDQLVQEFEGFCALHRWPLYERNPALVSCIQQAITMLFLNEVWHKPPPDAESLE
jgi:hypothetical protein